MKKIWNWRQPDWVRQRRDEVFRQHPDIRHFVEVKERLFKVLMGYIVLQSLVKIATMILLKGAFGIFFVFASIAGCFLYLYVLDECMSSSLDSVKRGGWWMLGLFVFNIIFSGQSLLQTILYSGGRVFSYMFLVVSQYPWMLVVFLFDIFSWIFFLVIIVIFIWMMWVPRNRAMAEQYDEMMTVRQQVKSKFVQEEKRDE